MGDVTDEPKRKEGKGIIENLAKLKYELQHDRQLTWVWCNACLFVLEEEKDCC